MDEKRKTRLQLVLVVFLISGGTGILLGWAAHTVFGLPFVLVSAIILLLIFVPGSRAMMKMPLDEKAELSSQSQHTRDLDNVINTSRVTNPRWHRVVLRGLLFGAFGIATVAVVALLHMSSRLGMAGAYQRLADSAQLSEIVAIALGMVVAGVLIAILLEVGKGWKR